MQGAITKDSGVKEKTTEALTLPCVRILNPSHYDSPIPENCIRFVCLSDTHSMVEDTQFEDNVPFGDVLLHAGDFTDHGEICQLVAFNRFIAKLPHRLKIATPGNHELTLDPRGLPHHVNKLRKDLGLPKCTQAPDEENYREVVDGLVALIPDVTLLVDSWVSVCGIKIHGYPWVPKHGLPGFGLDHPEDLVAKQELIPDDTDILLSHGPCRGFGDRTKRKNVGCLNLGIRVSNRIRPKLVVSGHIHEGRGVFSDGVTMYVNSAICNRVFRPVHNAMVLDYTLPKGYTRQDHVLTLTQQSLTVNKGS